MKVHIVKNFEVKSVGSISEVAVSLHYKLYEGYVNNLNKISEKLEKIKQDGNYTENFQEFNALHRRYAWEFNGVRLHEIFFGLLSELETSADTESNIYKKVVESFGSFESWKADFINLAKVRGFGWVALVYDRENNVLINTWFNEHDTGILANAEILLVVDVLEHAYILDFGTDRQKYMENIFAHLDWSKVNF